MENKSIKDKIIAIVADQLSISADKIELNQHVVDDLKADSLDVVEMLLKVEDEFGVNVSEEEAKEMKTISDFIAFVEKNV